MGNVLHVTEEEAVFLRRVVSEWYHDQVNHSSTGKLSPTDQVDFDHFCRDMHRAFGSLWREDRHRFSHPC